MRSLLPWHARIVAKLVLARLPTGYSFWHRFGLFSHGAMDHPSYAHEVFRSHFDRSEFGRKSGGFVGLELGPGDSALSAVIAAAYGATAYHLIDAGRFATDSIGPYLAVADLLRSRGLRAPDLTAAVDLDGVLALCSARYGTKGLASLRELPDASVDFVWSQAVLEHVRRADFLATMKELRRVLRPDGICSHTIDLKDHLGGGLNNMRLGSRLWEQEWMARSGFYTNRLRLSELQALFAQADFAVTLTAVRRWPAAPLQRQALAAEFRDLPEEDLLVKEADVLLRPL